VDKSEDFSLVFPEIRLTENVGEEKSTYAVFAGGCEGQGATSTTLAKMGNINMDFKIIWCREVDEVCLVQDRKPNWILCIR
jgi:hypothetical protein